MSDTLEHQLDLLLDTRWEQRRQCDADRLQKEKAIRGRSAEFETRQKRFLSDVRRLISDAVGQANRHFAGRSEACQFREVLGYRTGPLYVGGSACNPIAYELRVNGQEVGETLIVELTRDGLIDASLGPLRPSVPEAHTSRVAFGWRPIPLYQFDRRSASELVIGYLAAITQHWSLGGDTERRSIG